LKKQEFEPIQDGIIGNLSNDINNLEENAHMNPIMKNSKKKDLTSCLSLEAESYLFEYGSHAKDEFLEIMNQITSHNNNNFTLIDFRNLVPDTEISLLSVIFNLMEHLQIINQKEKINFFYQKADFNSSQFYEKNADSFGAEHKSVFPCFSCGKNSIFGRYLSEDYQLCANCFSIGNFPIDFSSSDFDFKGIMETESKWLESENEKWEEKTIKLLHQCVEEHGLEDWDTISMKVGKPVADCIYQFAIFNILEKKQNENVHQEILEIIGDASNHVMSIVNLLYTCVHPGIGAEAAKICLKSLILNTNQSLIDLSLSAFTQAISRASHLAMIEEKNVQDSIFQLLQLQNNRISFKCDLLSELQTSSANSIQHERALMIRLYELALIV
jgi:hypothetical protein